MERPDHITMPASQLESSLERLEGWRELRRAARGIDAYLVGGAVRDVLRGASRADLDVVVEGDLAELARRLGAIAAEHARFGTASVRLTGGGHVDLVAARSERYEHPGALPTVEPADLAADLGRRDFTVNAMAVPLADTPHLIDPHGGEADLRAGVLRALHERSFVDDPTRAIRAARYVARLGLQPEPATADCITSAELGNVSADRSAAELSKLAGEERAVEALALLETWGLATFEDPSTAALAARMSRVEPWS